jgi:hypothetical protein
MTKISKLILGAGALGVLGITALPLTSYAATADVTLSVTINASDSSSGGNNATGYVWVVSDKDGTKKNLALGDATGGASGGLALIANKVAKTTGVTANNSYGFEVIYTNGTGTATAGYAFTDIAAKQYYGNTQLVSGGITNASTPTAVETAAPGTVDVSIPSLSGQATGGANSAYKYDTSLAPGTYQNTLTITTLPKS